MQYGKLMLLLVTLLLAACSRNEPLLTPTPPAPPPVPVTVATPPATILVDASKDGGVWWYPQNGSYNPDSYHQGKALADYLRSLGFRVEEVPRGQLVNWSLMRSYRKVIRVGGFGNYLPQEIAAYDSLLHYGGSLLYLQDHLANFPNDQLSVHLGLNFSGSYTGNINQVAPHAVTQGVSLLPYIAGSLIQNPGSQITVLGKVTPSNGDSSSAVAMGILQHPGARIFFMGDTNGIESVPQPFTRNLVAWLFQ